MEIKIKHRFEQNTLFACNAENIREAVEKAVAAYANLTCADLAGANLVGANLDGANLDGANLACANLACANLVGANLDGANLACANLACANLAGTNLAGTNLARANLDGETLLIAPISITNLIWPVLITHGYMRIGCQRYSHEAWARFDEEDIKQMHSRASEFWGIWKEPLLAMCAKHRDEAMKVNEVNV